MISWVNIVVADGPVPVWRQDVCNHHDDVSQWEQLYRQRYDIHTIYANPDSKVHRANVGPTWVLSAPDGPHVGPMNLAIREDSKWFHGFFFQRWSSLIAENAMNYTCKCNSYHSSDASRQIPGLGKVGENIWAGTRKNSFCVTHTSYFWLYLYIFNSVLYFLQIVFFIIYQCTNIFHRRSLFTFYRKLFIGNIWCLL